MQGEDGEQAARVLATVAPLADGGRDSLAVDPRQRRVRVRLHHLRGPRGSRGHRNAEPVSRGPVVFAAMVFDALDGPMARLAKQTSEFGARIGQPGRRDQFRGRSGVS